MKLIGATECFDTVD